MKIASDAFEEGGIIPVQYTCDGADISPSLQWTHISDMSKSLVLICDDPDAVVGTWVHWVAFNISPGLNSIQEGIEAVESITDVLVHGINDFGRLGYGGPCPPNGMHRYFFRLYALDAELYLDPGCTKADVMEAMQGHIIDQASLLGRYGR